MFTYIDKLASAIKNDILSGLRGYHSNLSMNLEQLKDEIIEERLQVIKEYSLKGILPLKDLYISINCVPVDCNTSLERCGCNETGDCNTIVPHFEIPQIVNDYGLQSIEYIGSIDGQFPFVYYTSPKSFKNRKYRKRGKDKPYVWIDTTPNKNGMCDCFIFNAPLLNQISITAIFKDLRQLKNYSCCTNISDGNLSFIDTEVKKRIIDKKIKYYRQLQPSLQPNIQQYSN